MTSPQPTRGRGAVYVLAGAVGAIVGGALALNGSPWVGWPVLVICVLGFIAGLFELNEAL